MLLLLKAHVKGYTKLDGTYVKDHERGYSFGRDGGQSQPGHQASMFRHESFGHGLVAPQYGIGRLFLPAKPKAYHPKPDETGKAVGIYAPSSPTAPETWTDPTRVATFVPGGKCPASLNGVPFTPWTDHPETTEEWDYCEGVLDDLAEPGMVLKQGLPAASGVIIEELDGRIWAVSPTNGFGNHKNTFPKGKEEDEMSWQANAIKEAYEESGLKVKITGFLGDVQRPTSVTRYYSAVRVGGTPADVGWESQAVHLVPKSHLVDFMDSKADQDVLKLIL